MKIKITIWRFLKNVIIEFEGTEKEFDVFTSKVNFNERLKEVL